MSARVVLAGLLLGLLFLPALAWSQVAQYTLDQHVNDSIGSAHGTAVGTPTYAVGKRSYAISLNGTTQYVSLGTPAALNIPSTVTLTAWVNPTDLAGADHCVVGDMDTGGVMGQYMLLVQPGGNLIMAWGDTASVALFISTDPVVSTGTWQHIAATRDSGGNVALYYNGVATAGAFSDGGTTTPIVASPLGVGIGRGGEVDGLYFTGAIDDVRLYNTVLTAPQILALTQETALRRRLGPY